MKLKDIDICYNKAWGLFIAYTIYNMRTVCAAFPYMPNKHDARSVLVDKVNNVPVEMWKVW